MFKKQKRENNKLQILKNGYWEDEDYIIEEIFDEENGREVAGVEITVDEDGRVTYETKEQLRLEEEYSNIESEWLSLAEEDLDDDDDDDFNSNLEYGFDISLDSGYWEM